MPLPPDPGLRRAAAVVMLVGLGVVYLATMGRALSLDVASANLASWHIGVHGTPWVDPNLLPSLVDNPQRGFWIVERADGREVVGRAPGVIALAVPAYAVAGVLGFDSFSTVPGCVTAALVTAATLTLLFLTLRRAMPPRDAVLAVVLFGLTTPVWSVAADGVWPHTVTVLGIVGMAWACSRERWWLVGLFGGVALSGRLHAAVICAVVGLLLAWWRRDSVIAVRMGVASAAVLALTSVWTQWMYGTWDPTAAYDAGAFVSKARETPLDLMNQLAFWVSPGRGLLVWTPLVLVLGAGVLREWRSLPDWSRALVVAGFVYTILQLTLNVYKGGEGFFGYRLGLEMLACLTPALALSAHRMGGLARRLFVPVAIAQFAVFLFGALSNPRQAPRISNRWDSNELVSRVVEQPLYSLTLLIAGVALGAIIARMWNDPDLLNREREAIDA